jgi:peptidoglycan/LPS O-acetylase OafA/YrhL
MGSYRLLLAYCVLYSHVFGNIEGFNPGIIAVISFFVMSGYVMTFLLDRHYPGLADTGRFYADRAARLFPQYLFYLTATIIAVSVLGIVTHFMSDFRPLSIALTYAMLPVGYYMFGLQHAQFMPWTMGTEFTFYVVFPFVWRLSANLRNGIFLVSIVIGAVAYLGIVNTDWYGYRLLPGILFIFLCGASLSGRLRSATFMPLVAGVLAAAGLAAALVLPKYGVPYNREVMAGIVIGLVAVAALRKLRFTALDEFLGNLSYGLFLNHYLVMLLADRFGVSRIVVPFAALALSAWSYWFIERPALRWRRHLRAINSATSLSIGLPTTAQS